MVKVIQPRGISRSPQGFTLIEVLVAILILSMITMIMGVTLKLCIRAWDRGQAEGDTFQIKASIPMLLQKQLGSLVLMRAFSSAEKQENLVFMGTESTLSFFTTHVPEMIINRGGLHRVTYIYNKDAGQLDIYQQLIATAADMSDEFNPLSDDWDGELQPKGTIHGIIKFSIAYASDSVIDINDQNSWVEEWAKTKSKLPAGLKIIMQFEQDKKKNTDVWYFGIRTGI